MKLGLKSIELRNFRCFEHLQQDLSARALMVGPTGAGKSTVIDAIRWVLTGRCRGIDGKGVGQQDLIMDGADEASVTLTIEGFPIQATRTVNAKGAQANPKPEAILQRLGVSDAVMECLLEGRTFFAMHHADAKKLIMRILDATIDASEIAGLKVPPGTRLDLDSLEMHYNDAFDRRAGAKRALEMVHVPEPPKVQNIADGPVGDVDALRKDRDATRAAAGRARDAWTQAKTRIESTRAEHQRSLAAEQSIDKVRSQLEAQVAMRADLQQKLDNEGPEEKVSLFDREATDELPRLRRMVESIEKHDPKRGCVLSDSIPCLTLARDFAGHVRTIQAEIGELETRRAAVASKAEEVQKRNAQRSLWREQIKMHDGQIELFTQRLKDAEAALKNRARIESDQRTHEQAELQAREESLAADRAGAAAEAKFEAALRYYAATSGRDEALKRHEALKQDVAELETLVEILGPTGIRVRVIERAVTEFEEMINAALEAFGFRMFIKADPWSVQIGRVLENGTVPPETIKKWAVYSEGEKIVIALAFQQALAVLTEIDFVCVDASESVTGDFRSTLTGLVMTSPVQQIVMAMGKGPQEPLPQIDGLQVIPFEMAEQPA